MIEIKKAGAENIQVIQDLAKITWAISYASIISPEQMEFMLDLFYSTTSLKKQMQNGHCFIIAWSENFPWGFASYSRKFTENEETYRLHKLYLAPDCQGKGVGKQLIVQVLNDIRPIGANCLELNVNRANKAFGFYQRLGFSIVREEDIDIGNGYFMNDYVMEMRW